MRWLALLLGGCAAMTATRFDGHLDARPAPGAVPFTQMASGPGRHPLRLGEGRDGFLYVPSTWQPGVPSALVVLLHGAAGSGDRILTRFAPLADELGLLILAPDSRERTWDGPLGDLGPDIVFLDRALGYVFERYLVDRKRIALAGFSDGASEALTVGLINGVLFTHVMAFSPGAVVTPTRTGWPRIFVSHGTADEVLPIEQTGRPIATRLRAVGYDLIYREFNGGHLVPESVMRGAFDWLMEK
jgi:phospholipase/carboxylesterase